MTIKHQIEQLRVLLRSRSEDYSVGTVRHWKKGDHVKQRDGTWERVRKYATVSKPISSSEPAKDLHLGFEGTTKTTEDLFKKDGVWTTERTALHAAYAAGIANGLSKSTAPTVYMTGGGPASGKSEALLNNPKTGIPDKTKAAHADPDGAKGWIPEYSTFKNSDTSAAARVHEESSFMSQEAIKAGLAAGHDVVYDSTGDSGIEKLAAKVQKIRDQGAKRVVAHYVGVDVEEAIRRSDDRAEKTGRYVPHDYLRQVHRDVTATVLAAIERGVYDTLDLWDNSGSEPTHVASYDKTNGLKLHDEAGWETFKKRGQ